MNYPVWCAVLVPICSPQDSACVARRIALHSSHANRNEWVIWHWRTSNLAFALNNSCQTVHIEGAPFNGD